MSNQYGPQSVALT